MLRIVKNETYGQTLKMLDGDDNLVSVANTEDNGWETAVCIDDPDIEGQRWYIKKGNHKNKIKRAKTIDEALTILYSIDAERSEYSTDHQMPVFERM